jgi:hypothetical protein
MLVENISDSGLRNLETQFDECTLDFALMGTLWVGAQSLGILVTGPIASEIFEPLLENGGRFANSVGALIGTGPVCGMAFMFTILGFLVVGIAALSWLKPSIRFLEDHLPDYELPGGK